MMSESQNKLIQIFKMADSQLAIEHACSNIIRNLLDEGLNNKGIEIFLKKLIELLQKDNSNQCSFQERSNMRYAADFLQRIMNAAAVAGKIDKEEHNRNFFE